MVKLITSTLLVLLLGIGVYGQAFDSGSTGADGPFNPPSRVPAGTQVQGDCTSGCTVTVPLREPPNHVFNFTTVTIGQPVTVNFRRNVVNTPVFILAQGDVRINGAIDIRGQDAVRELPRIAAEGGPGGYTGGFAAPPGTSLPGGAGSGPGGGAGGRPGSSPQGAGGSFVGVPELLPLIGGSGGGGNGDGPTGCGNPGNGGGGGGAIYIGSSTLIEVGSRDNVVAANGGSGACNAGGGSGGAIRLAAPRIIGQGILRARGGGGGGTGGDGRVRFEGDTRDFAGGSNPGASFGAPAPPFPPITPTIRIVSIGGTAVPRQLTSNIFTPDLTLPAVPNPLTIALEATNVPSDTRAIVTIAPQIGSGDRVITLPVALTGPPGQPKRGTVTVNVPSRGVGFISARIDGVAPEQ